MPDQFKHYWPLSAEEKKDLWANGVIILDTNVYLHVYRLPDPARDQLLQVLEHPKIVNRLWVPHRVADEFFRNRVSIIADQITCAKKCVASLDKGVEALCGEIDKAIRQHHPLIDREMLKQSLKKVGHDLEKNYEERKVSYPVDVFNDPFLARVHRVMGGRIGAGFSDSELAEARKEAKQRFELKFPPGYEDAGKDGDRAFGDYLIWRQILKDMEAQRQHAILVLDDRKEDWWLKQQGQRLGPRPELRKEYSDRTGKDIDFATSERFLQWAAKELDLEMQSALDAAIAEVAADRSRVHNIVDWLLKHQGDESSSRARSTHDVATPEEMVEWFIENYEDPAESVPYETAEGGYQYFAGGPYDAHDEISDQFPDAEEQSIERAVEIINGLGGPEWVRKGEY